MFALIAKIELFSNNLENFCQYLTFFSLNLINFEKTSLSLRNFLNFVISCQNSTFLYFDGF